jgi:hypothetical protein
MIRFIGNVNLDRLAHLGKNGNFSKKNFFPSFISLHFRSFYRAVVCMVKPLQHFTFNHITTNVPPTLIFRAMLSESVSSKLCVGKDCEHIIYKLEPDIV